MTMKSAHYKRKGLAKSSVNTKSEMKKQLDCDSHFCYNMTLLIGSLAELETKDGTKYEGVFVAFSGQQELMLEATHMVQEKDSSSISKHFDSVIVPAEKVAAVTFRDVDLSYATRDFKLDGSIAGSRGVTVDEKEWERMGQDWEDPEVKQLDEKHEMHVVNLDINPAHAMFKRLETLGVGSSFRADLAGYTTRIDKSDPEAFKKQEELALKLASEIAANPTSMERIKVENVGCEEDAFSAVVRVREEPPTTHSANSGTSSGNGKYIPPSKRQSQYNSDSASGGHSQIPNGSVPQQGAAGGGGGGGGGMAGKKPLYGTSVRGNFPPNSASTSSYHNDRRQHETRRPPPSNLPPQNSHQDLRRSDDGNSLNKHKPMKGRVDLSKTTKGLHDFHANFNLQLSGDGPQNKRGERGSQSHQPVNKPAYGNRNQSTSTNMNPSQDRGGGRGSVDNVDVGPSYGSQHNKPKEEPHPENQKPQSPVQKPTETSESVKPCDVSLHSEKTETFAKASDNSAAPPVDNTLHDVKDASPPKIGSGDSKSEVTTPSADDLKSRKFTFNPHAKEFNPGARVFSPKSPATPPRPPNDLSNNAQVLGSPSVPHAYIPMSALIFNPQTGIVQGPSPPAPTGNSQRPPQRKGLIGVGQRSDMSQQISLQQGVPSLIGSTQLQPNGSHYTILPYSQVRLPNPNMLPLYTEAAGGQQMQLPVHYYQHGSPTQPNSSQHTQAGNTVSVSVPNPHGYAQTHPYPFLGIPMGWNPAHSNSQQIAYVPHGGTGGPHG